MNEFKCCAVCGDRVKSNVKLVWNRDSDNKFFSVCCMCAESNKVNAKSVDNFADGLLVDYVPHTTVGIRRSKRAVRVTKA